MTGRAADVTTLRCQECPATCADHRWGKTRAHADGWYFQRDGRVFCPTHRPPYAPPAPAGRTDA